MVTVDAPEGGTFDEQDVILVLQGQTTYSGAQVVSFNADVSSGPFRDVAFNIYYVPVSSNPAGVVRISNLERIVVQSAPSRSTRQ